MSNGLLLILKLDTLRFSLSSGTSGRRYFNTASGGKQVIISMDIDQSDYDDYGLESATGINYTGNNENAGEAYYPYQYGVYMWVRTA